MLGQKMVRSFFKLARLVRQVIIAFHQSNIWIRALLPMGA
jgi:hypothetical protein